MNNIFSSLRIAFWNFTGSCLATIPPLYVDPKLTKRLIYGERHYENTWIVYLCCVLIFVATFIIARHDLDKKRGILTINLPLVVSLAFMLYYFLPEFPHACVLFMHTVTFVISSCLLFIVSFDFKDPELDTSENAAIEYYKQHISIWKSFCLGLMFALIATLVGIFKQMMEMNAFFVGSDVEQTDLINRLTFGQIAFIVLYILCGPINEALKNVIKSMERLRMIRKIS